MSIYWERCPLCGKYTVTYYCRKLGTEVCLHCCLLYCSNLDECIASLKV